MTDLLVLAFDTEDGAATVRNRVVELNKQFMLDLREAVEVIRRKDGKVKINQEPRLTGFGALGGAFWGFLIGLIFLMPLVGVAVGVLAGAIVGHFSSYGISKDFMKNVEKAIQPGQSALFILADNVKLDRLIPMLEEYHPRVLRTSLSQEQEARLREAFGNASVAVSTTAAQPLSSATQTSA